MIDIKTTETGQKTTFQTVGGVYSENSFGIVDQEDGVKLTFNVGVNDEAFTMRNGYSCKPYYYGSFEWYSDDERWYCEGGLWFNEDKELDDYDGCYSLATEVMDAVEKMGFNVDEMRDCLTKP